MSATVEGAMKALLESLGMGLAAYRDLAPEGAPLPYVVVSSVDAPLEPTGDFGDAAASVEVREQVDVSLWQAIKDPHTGAHVASPDTAAAIVKRIRGRVLPDVLGGRCYPLTVQGVARIPTRESNVQRESISVTVVRVIGGTQ